MGKNHQSSLPIDINVIFHFNSPSSAAIIIATASEAAAAAITTVRKLIEIDLTVTQ